MPFRLKPHKPYSFFIEHTERSGSSLFADQLHEQLASEAHRPIVLVCIGSDRSTGDSLGPLVGTFLEEKIVRNLYVYGTLTKPVHALNLVETLHEIQTRFHRPLIIAIDACLGRLSSVGYIFFSEGPLAPGAGVQKELPAVGEYNIKAVVNVSGFMEMMILQNTRLHLVYELARFITEGFAEFDARIGRLHHEEAAITRLRQSRDESKS
ncbi:MULTISPECIES: spore protease YyaC [Exiguobacterium]|uniref:spore protease YyaC n=1 Tax=Exiguobacterium TaxID=33986 RepID=UPI001BE7A74A|nr:MULTISPECIES: spore protease YyaC [Exiguobacterium]MCT4784584.1 spore protease YyaC [Exiguobacterium himgiriensis]